MLLFPIRPFVSCSSPRLQIEGTCLIKVRRNTCPNPTQSHFPISCSFVMGDLVGGGDQTGEAPSTQAPEQAWACGPSPTHWPAHVCPCRASRDPPGASPPRASQVASARGADWCSDSPFLNLLLLRNSPPFLQGPSGVLRARKSTGAPSPVH